MCVESAKALAAAEAGKENIAFCHEPEIRSRLLKNAITVLLYFLVRPWSEMTDFVNTYVNNQKFASPIPNKPSYELLDPGQRKYERILFLTCPTGAYCREDRCQSFFEKSLVPSMRPPLEECEAGGAIASTGATFLVIDSPALKLNSAEVTERVLDFNPDLIVLSVTFGSLEEDLKWAVKCKASCPCVPVGLRGAPCYVQPERLLRCNRAVDFCLRGDYELIFRLLIEFGLNDTPGVYYKRGPGDLVDGGLAIADNLDELPFPDRSGIVPDLYTVRGLGRAQATIRVQRGCPFPCTYCLVHTVSGNRARHRSPKNIVDEMQELVANGYRFFYLRAETFSVDRSWALELVREIALRCPEARWVTTTRVECVDDELLGEMKRAGCYGISFGIDVTSSEIAKRVRKPLRKAEAQKAIEDCRKHGIISLAYVMIGFIWDTVETLNESSRFVRAINADLLTVHYAHPYPGTVYYQQVKESTVFDKVASIKAQAEPALPIGHLGTCDIELFGKKMLRMHKRRPKIVWSLGRNLLRLYWESLGTGNVSFSRNHVSPKLQPASLSALPKPASKVG